jgi:hypothetical protein
MTNAALLLQSLSLSLDTTPAVHDRNNGQGVSWGDGQLTFTTAQPLGDDEPDQHEIGFAVTTDELAELHRILTAHLGRAEYGNELATDAGYVILHRETRGVLLEVGADGDTAEVWLSDTEVAAWHTKLTFSLLSASLSA